MNKTNYKELTDCEIVLYKKGSRGEILAIHQSIMDIVKIERVYNPTFGYTNVYHALTGHSKSYISYHYQCRVIPKLRSTKFVK